MNISLINDFLIASLETLYMVALSTIFAILLGLPLGTWAFVAKNVKKNQKLSMFLDWLINLTRSIPFIILLVAIIPFTRFIVGTSIGTNAAIVPLSLGATPFFARLVQNAYLSLPEGLIETGFVFGASSLQMIRLILLPEATAAIINAITVTIVTLINYSAMAGTVGGGGLGDLAIRYGYQRFNVGVMVATVIALIIMVQVFQKIGDKLALKYMKL